MIGHDWQCKCSVSSHMRCQPEEDTMSVILTTYKSKISEHLSTRRAAVVVVDLGRNRDFASFRGRFVCWDSENRNRGRVRQREINVLVKSRSIKLFGMDNLYIRKKPEEKSLYSDKCGTEQLTHGLFGCWQVGDTKSLGEGPHAKQTCATALSNRHK